MAENWADVIAERIVGQGPSRGSVLFLGAADTGKTTLMNALAERLVQTQPVALVDADVGQSHIGPPATVGWTVLNQTDGTGPAPPRFGAAAFELPARGIAFVGDVTPVGHLLQLTAALALCVAQAARAADVVLIDTPGLVTGGVACSLWWTVQRLLRPERIIAVQRADELGDVLRGLRAGLSAIEVVEAPSRLRRKSPEARQQHRNRLWGRYFGDATAYKLDLENLAVRVTQRMTIDNTLGRIVSFADLTGQDVALGAIEQWRHEEAKATIRAPRLDVQRVRCLTVGDVRIEIPFGRS